MSASLGAATAAFNAFSFALPVAGSTWKATAGLSLTGGPVTFMAQQEATRQILDSADYKDLASHYDPFDPVGLTLSTLVPAAFGSLAMRGAARARAREEVEAARVVLQNEHIDATNPNHPTDITGANLHRTAVAKAIDQMADGQRVDVTDSVPPAAAEHITQVMEQRLQPIRTADPLRDRPGVVPRDPSLSAEDKVIESKLAAKVTDDFEGAAVEYGKLKDSMGGNPPRPAQEPGDHGPGVRPHEGGEAGSGLIFQTLEYSAGCAISALQKAKRRTQCRRFIRWGG